ncbi:hypothetical protein MtrunA17_Chr4g0027751 [Medicago truncatula]|uniref:Uncharacterized protein n=2 Tax=Medicago truncatula TaxID=3880 RepID=A0A072UJU5_MEDTR|nr:hypothetical protein MTR_4g056580 [Medicago truncatula]RHN60614.1 hypothetical protein MtrunA17_Chr4g0027751 [Medicago truncatula]
MCEDNILIRRSLSLSYIFVICVTSYMSTTRSEETQIPRHMEESIIKQEKREQEEEEEANIPKPIQVEEVIFEELEECKTPTSSSNKIPIVEKCPPAPKKKRKSSISPNSCMMKRSSATQLKYDVKAEEVDSFFQSMFEVTKVINKRRRTI